MKETVEEKDLYFVAEGVAVGGGLSGGGFEGDGEISRVGAGDLSGCWEAEDVSRLIFTAKKFVEAAESEVISEQDFDFAAETNGVACAVEEASEA
jgi:hypothetical protein